MSCWKFLVTTVLIFLSHLIFGQEVDTTLLFKVEYEAENVRFISYVDGDKIIVRNQFESQKASFDANRLVISKDSLVIRDIPNKSQIKDIFIHTQPMAILIENSSLEGYNSKYSLLDLKDGSLTELDIKGLILSSYDDNLIWGHLNSAKYDGYGDYITELMRYSLAEHMSSPLVKLETTSEEAQGIVNVFPFRKEQTQIIKQAYCYIPLNGCEESRSFVFNEENSSLQENPNDELLSQAIQHFPTISDDHFLVKTNNGYSLYSQTGKLDTVLDRLFEVIGWNYANNKLQSYNVESTLDEEKYKNGKTLKEVIIPYKLSSAVEMSSQTIVGNKVIDEDNLTDCTLSDLLILKNFVFAKHNYAFDSHFYQAYFNLFDYYNNENKRATRTKNMDGLLTKADLQNLEMINEALKRFE